MISKILTTSLLGFLCVWTQAQPLLPYTSPDAPGYKTYERTSQYVTMNDSVKLAVDVYIPTKGPARDTFPVVFKMTPYARAYIGPNVGFVFRTLSLLTGMGWRPLMDQERYSESISLLLEHGYAVVAADMRGTGASFGRQMPLDPQHGKDGKELVDWIAEQPFSNGRVGMIGKSYMAWAQFATAAQQPEALKCMAPEVIFFESFTGSFKPGGIIAERWMNTFSDRLHHMNLNFSDIREFYIPAAPVIDEDGDGRLEDEWPLIDSTIYETDARPQYRDHDNRTEHYYWNATRDHLENIQVVDLMGEDFGYFDSETTMDGFNGYTYRDVAPGYFLESVIDFGIPIFHIGRWQDGFTRGATQLFASAQHLGNQRMLISPGFHMSRFSKQQRKFMSFDTKLGEMLSNEHLRFFDRHLKELENGLGTLPPVQLFVPHKGWQFADEWPPKETSDKVFYLSNGKLLSDAPEAGIDTISVDTTHRSSYGKDNHNRWTMASGNPKNPMERTEIDKRTTLYEGEVLQSDVDIIGHPVVELWITANRPNVDVFVYLEDVDEKGRAFYVTEGQLRASWHRETELAETLGVDYTVRPELPWHGYTKAFEDKDPLESGDPILMRFDLMPIAWHFAKGHRIRISIAGMDKENFEINPAYFKDEKLQDDVEIYLHQSDEHRSVVTLPMK